MSKKASGLIHAKSAVCKEPNCFSSPDIKGFCRLHFIKALAGKSQLETVSVEKGALKERRRSNRLKGIEVNQGEESEMSENVNLIGELDTDVEGLDSVSELSWKKTG